jgi:uncharacterized membrane protein YeaQ/YmgE (transglycosylase-associated protein family)
MLWTILVGALVGWLAALIVKGEGLGILGDILIGIFGAWLGNFIAGMLGIVAYGLLGKIAIALGGAVILLIVLRAAFSGKKKKR